MNPSWKFKIKIKNFAVNSWLPVLLSVLRIKCRYLVRTDCFKPTSSDRLMEKKYLQGKKKIQKTLYHRQIFWSSRLILTRLVLRCKKSIYYHGQLVRRQFNLLFIIFSKLSRNYLICWLIRLIILNYFYYKMCSYIINYIQNFKRICVFVPNI